MIPKNFAKFTDAEGPSRSDWEREYWDMVERWMRKKVTWEMLAEGLDITLPTLRRKRRTPGKLTLEGHRKMMRFLHIPKEEYLPVMLRLVDGEGGQSENQ